MQSPREILADLWTLVGGGPAALDSVTLAGEEPQLPSSFRVAAAAQTQRSQLQGGGPAVGRRGQFLEFSI